MKLIDKVVLLTEEDKVGLFTLLDKIEKKVNKDPEDIPEIKSAIDKWKNDLIDGTKLHAMLVKFLHGMSDKELSA